MRRKLGKFLMLCGALSLLCAGGLLVHNLVENERAGEAAREAVTAVKAQVGACAGVKAPVKQMSVAEIDGLAYIGWLSMPTVGQELPILAELTDAGLQIAPGRYCGSTCTDDLVLGAHNFSFHFGVLNDLKVGDRVNFTDMDGIVSRYEVAGTEILQPTDIEKMKESDADLTLFTCTYGGASRVTVRCERVYG